MRNPVISIIMPTFGHADMIWASINSLVRQTFPDFELIVVSDGADDATDVEVLKFTDSRIAYKFIEHGNDFGIAALNYGMSLARGDFLTMASSDNLYFSNYLRTLLEGIDETGVDFVFGDFLLFDTAAGSTMEFPRPVHLSGEFAIEHLAMGYTVGICFLFRRGIWEQVKPYRVSAHSDYDLVARMAIVGAKFHHINSVLGVNVIHPTQTSVTDRSPEEENRIRLMVADHLISQGAPGAHELKSKALQHQLLIEAGKCSESQP